MMRRVLTVVSVFLIGMFGAMGLAAAAPPPYPAPPAPTLSVTDLNGNSLTDANGNNIITVGAAITFSGDGFDPLEGIDGTISYVGPNGLRSTIAASRLATATAFSDAADNNGHFAHQVTLDQAGTATLTATGRNSGKSVSLTVQVGAAAAGAAAAAAGGPNDSGSGLARTGVSIAGPLIIGLGALLVGLAMLFFGTRGVIRRNSAKSSSSA